MLVPGKTILPGLIFAGMVSLDETTCKVFSLTNKYYIRLDMFARDKTFLAFLATASVTR